LNTADGVKALFANTSGWVNTASGFQALYSNSTGHANTASGYQSLYSNTSGYDNTACGAGALSMCMTGSNNTAAGFNALLNTTAYLNTAYGSSALLDDTTGFDNIGIGFDGGENIGSGSYNIEIGNVGASSDANTIRIGIEGTQTATYIAGISGESVASGAQIVYVDSTGKLGTTLAPISIIGPVKLNAAVARLEERDKNLEASNIRLKSTVAAQGVLIAAQAKRFASLEQINAQQQQDIKALTASLKEQASLLEKVSAQIQVNRTSPRMAENY
jgi:hypothetical protein